MVFRGGTYMAKVVPHFLKGGLGFFRIRAFIVLGIPQSGASGRLRSTRWGFHHT
jgi:hypothetical protein